MLGVSKKLSLIIAMVGQINKFVEWGHDWFLVQEKVYDGRVAVQGKVLPYFLLTNLICTENIQQHYPSRYIASGLALLLRFSVFFFSWGRVIAQAPVVQKVDSAIWWINLYPVDSVIGFLNTYPLDSDLSNG